MIGLAIYSFFYCIFLINFNTQQKKEIHINMYKKT